MTAMLSWMKARAMAGLRCMVSTLLGQKPRVSLKNLASSRVSGSWSGGTL